MPTTTELAKVIGMPVVWRLRHGKTTLRLPAIIVDAKMDFGLTNYQIELHGNRLWVSENAVILDPKKEMS